ncbi:hypothetical protein IH879_05470 [candidate division KSB1 bacterium]|nr:hypothetical protein [candidate division KSB1 bacterium]
MESRIRSRSSFRKKRLDNNTKSAREISGMTGACGRMLKLIRELIWIKKKKAQRIHSLLPLVVVPRLNLGTRWFCASIAI